MRVKVRVEKEKGVTESSSCVYVCVCVYFSFSVFQILIVVGLPLLERAPCLVGLWNVRYFLNKVHVGKVAGVRTCPLLSDDHNLELLNFFTLVTKRFENRLISKKSSSIFSCYKHKPHKVAHKWKENDRWFPKLFFFFLQIKKWSEVNIALKVWLLTSIPVFAVERSAGCSHAVAGRAPGPETTSEGKREGQGNPLSSSLTAASQAGSPAAYDGWWDSNYRARFTCISTLR